MKSMLIPIDIHVKFQTIAKQRHYSAYFSTLQNVAKFYMHFPAFWSFSNHIPEYIYSPSVRNKAS